MSTPALDRAAEAYYAHVPDFPDEGGWACEAVGCDFRTAAFAADEWQQHFLTAAVSAALHDPDDPDWLAEALYRADYPLSPRAWDDLNAVTRSRYRQRADAVRSVILGTVQ